MFAVTRLRATGDDGEALAAAVAPLLEALGARPGYVSGELGRSADDPFLWALVTRWDGVGFTEGTFDSIQYDEVSGTDIGAFTLALENGETFTLLVYVQEDLTVCDFL